MKTSIKTLSAMKSNEFPSKASIQTKRALWILAFLAEWYTLVGCTAVHIIPGPLVTFTCLGVFPT